MRKLLKAAQVFGLLLLLFLTWAVSVYHASVVLPPRVDKTQSLQTSNQWIPKDQLGINQLVLFGTPYERGLFAGEKTSHLLFRQESELTKQLHHFFSNELVRKFLEVLTMRWFWGLDRYLEPWMTEEMYGVSKSAPHEFDYLGNGFNRQISYHALHEVGQMMVDQGSDDMGCTVVALPSQSSWVIGRNFDFEGGRTFDSEKILKWVYPDQGYAFVSVIWAGMVGAVTGVNEHGVYISLNAAGSRDFRRQGTPSTLVLLKALQFSKSAKEAIEIIRQATMFITDIFVIADRSSKALYRIEKSPDHTEVISLGGPSIVTNHLISPRWAQDSINLYRKNELTSDFRSERGEKLLKEVYPLAKISPENFVLNVLRDKGTHEGKPLHLGNRRAIDALIATHAVVYDAPKNILYISVGPGVSGPLIGFDLSRSFQEKKPIRQGDLPRDPAVSDETFHHIKVAAQSVSKAEKLLHHGSCDEAKTLLEEARNYFTENSSYYSALGDYFQCKGEKENAKKAWAKAIEFVPAYPAQLRKLQSRMKE